MDTGRRHKTPESEEKIVSLAAHKTTGAPAYLHLFPLALSPTRVCHGSGGYLRAQRLCYREEPRAKGQGLLDTEQSLQQLEDKPAPLL